MVKKKQFLSILYLQGKNNDVTAQTTKKNVQ